MSAPRVEAQCSTRALGLTLALGGLMVTVDTTVALVAVPAIASDIGASLPTVQWVTTGYLLGVVGVIPVAAWAANRFGARRTYVTGLVVFTLASATACLASGPLFLIVSRVVQGLGGGLLNPVGQAIGLRAVDRERRGRLMSLLGLPVVIGPVLGPPLAGWLADDASWRWIFGINVPVGVLAIALSLAVLPRQLPGVPPGPVDWAGLALVSGGAVLLVLGCTRWGESGALDATVWVPVAAGVGLVLVFVQRSHRVARPLLDLGLLRHPPLRHGLMILAAFGAGYFGSGVVLPVLVQGVRGDPATLAGVITLPQAIGVGITLQVATRLVDRVHPRRIVPVGVAVGLVGTCLLLLTATTNASYAALSASALVLGVGSGATLMPTMTYAVRDLAEADTPAGTTLLALVQQVASAVGVALTASSLTLLVAARVPRLDAGDAGGLQAMLDLDDAARADLVDALAAAAGASYAVPVALVATGLLAAVLTLRRGSTEDEDG